MKKITLTLFTILALSFIVKAQNYNNIVNYALNTTPTYGVKIKTNLPFTPGTQMPTITITGYSYGLEASISLIATYYIYSGGPDFNDPVNYYVNSANISSSGAYTPKVYISNEGGKVVLFLDSKVYYQCFTVSAFAMGMVGETAAAFQDWTVADEPLSGTKTHEFNYVNRFAGNVFMPANGVWNSAGNVGIGTTSPQEKLSVNGKIRVQEIKVETTNWPDYVFTKDYKLPALSEIEKHIKEKGYLPGMPSAKEAETNGVNLGDLNKKLLQKVEELTLYSIEKEKTISALLNKMEEMNSKLNMLLDENKKQKENDQLKVNKK